MTETLSDHLRQDMQCESLLQCFHGLKPLDKRCYEILVDNKSPVTIDQISEEVDRERSTVYRSIQRLLNTGIIQKEQVNYKNGGYYHVYYPTDPEDVTDTMQRMLNDWYAKMGQLIQEFENKYEDRIESPPTVNP